MAQTIKKVMTADPKTLSSSSTVEEAAQMMKSEDIGDVIVVNRNKKLVGILTDRDIVIRAAAGDADFKTIKVEDILTKDVVSIAPDASIDDAVAIMGEAAIRRLPVVDDGKVVGIVSLGDLAVERDPASALGAISAAEPDQASTSMNGRKAGIEIGKAIPAVAFGASLAFAMSKVRGRSRRKTVKIAAKKLRRAGKKLQRTGDKVGADAASRAADYVTKASKDIQKSGKKFARESSKQLESKLADVKKLKLDKKIDRRVAGVKRKLEDARTD